ncbi:MAG: FxLYD domain-containing protein [Anaerolineae bacterium]
MTHLRTILSAGLVGAALLAAWGCAENPTPTLAPGTPRATSGARRSPTAMPSWTAEPVTPTATATATASPTPIVYAIQSGDTLLDVATRFGASAADIQEVNGITDPRTLQIGQELIIPVSAGAEFATPTATPMPVHPVDVSHNRTVSGDVVVVGEVANDSTAGVEEVAILVELVDDNGAVVASGETTAMLDVIPVGGRAPYAMTLTQAPAYTQVRCRVLRAMPEVPERAVHRDLTVSEVSGRAVYDRTFVVMGKVRNTGDAPAVDVFVVVTLYGDDGTVLGARREPLPEAIDAGSRSLFQVTLVPVGWPVENFEVYVEGRMPVATETPSPSPTP